MKINLNKQFILESAWDIDTHASAEARNLTNAASRENFEKNPIQFATWCCFN